MTAQTKKRILLVDDDQNILTSVSLLLEAEGFDVMTYTDGATALLAFNQRPVDLAVLDIKMPRLDGYEVLKRLKERSSVPVIFLTSCDDDMDEVEGLSLGADDYIRKPFSQRLLLERIKAVLRRADPIQKIERQDHEKIITRGDLMLDPLQHRCSWKGREVNLTVTEFLILQSLAQHPGFVKSRDQLMDTTYSDDIYVDDRTIDSHIKRLRKKIRLVDPEFNAIKTLYGVGYQWTEAMAA